MGAKSEKKRQFIIEKAREVFASKGFSSVTMKDIVEACGISRGGLYIYFDSTAGIFEEVLDLEKSAGNDDEIEKADTAVEMISAFLREQKKEILGKETSLITALYEYYFFLGRDTYEGKPDKAEGKESSETASDKGIAADSDDADGLAENGSIQSRDGVKGGKGASKNAALGEKTDGRYNLAGERQRFKMSVKVLEKLIKAGMREGYLDCEEPLSEAYNIMYAIEGLKICSATIGVTDEEVTRQINFLYSHLFIRDEE